jgi:cytochrome c556
MAASERTADRSCANQVVRALRMALPAALVAVVGLWPRVLPAADPVQVVMHRQAEMNRMATAMRVMGRFLKNEGATVAEVAASAATIRAVAVGITGELFPEGTGIGVGESAARPEIWQQWDVFSQDAAALTATAGRLATVAASGDAGAVRAPIVAVVRACGTCHEFFRQKKP